MRIVTKSMNNGKFCVKCGGKLIEQVVDEIVESQENIIYKTNKKVVIILTCLFLVITGILVTIGIVKINDYEEQLEIKNSTINSKNKKISEYETELMEINWERNEYKEKADFLDENIVFVLDGYGRYYYTYDQVQEVTQGKAYSYWAYTDVEAKSKGYKKWK